MTYLANRHDDVLQRVQRGGQGVDRDPDPRVNVPPPPLLYGVIEGKERRPRVPPVEPPDLGSSLGVWVAADLDQRSGRLSADPRQHRSLSQQ